VIRDLIARARAAHRDRLGRRLNRIHEQFGREVVAVNAANRLLLAEVEDCRELMTEDQLFQLRLRQINRARANGAVR
jgi:hypothetical protein